jgi:hypothetical protein
VQPAAPAGSEEAVSAPVATPVPTLEDQIRDGLILFWFHDTSLEGLKVYQYRVRLVLVNPLVGLSDDVRDPQDAKKALIPTPFSDWSNSISIPQATEFFVTGQSPPQGFAYVDVFARSLGQWVSRKFRVGEGMSIGEKISKVKVTSPDGMPTSMDVDFSTGAVVVRLDFEKTVEKTNLRRATVEMVYLNEKGQLLTRVGLIDKESERCKHLEEEAKRAKSAGSR